MNTKLTLKLDKYVIDSAKKYAASRRKSLSRMIESYLRSIIIDDSSDMKEDKQISPFVKSMSTGVKIPSDYDYKKEYGDHVSKKYK